MEASLRVLIFESELAGHRSHYVSLLVTALQELEVSVCLATKVDSLAGSLAQHHLGDHLKDVEIFPLDKNHTEIERLHSVVHQGKPDHLLVPTADPLSLPLFFDMIRGRGKQLKKTFSEALFFGPGFGYRQERVARKIGNPIRKSLVIPRMPWRVMAHVDPYQCAALNSSQSHLCELRPDPAPAPACFDQQAARESLKLPLAGRMTGCSGAISVDKGIVELVDSFAALANQSAYADTFLLLAGKFQDTVTNHLSNRHKSLVDQGRIICIDRHLDETEMEQVFVALDFVVAAHRGRPGSSGIVLRAAAAATPVLAREKYWTQRIVPEFGLGWTCKTWVPEKFEAGLGMCFEEASKYRQSAKTKRYVQFQSEDNFRAHWTREIRQRLGAEPDPRLVSWEWVTQGDPNLVTTVSDS